MRPTPWLSAEPYRVQIPELITTKAGDDFGSFVIPYASVVLRCIVSSGRNARKFASGRKYAWDHVSVSVRNRAPYWDEMTYIKDIFFAEDETVFQFHPPADEHINIHPFTLHLWRPLLVKVPLPPKDMV